MSAGTERRSTDCLRYMEVPLTSDLQTRILRPPIIWAGKTALIVALVLFFFLAFLWAFAAAIAGTAGANHILKSWIISGIEVSLLTVCAVWVVYLCEDTAETMILYKPHAAANQRFGYGPIKGVKRRRGRRHNLQ